MQRAIVILGIVLALAVVDCGPRRVHDHRSEGADDLHRWLKDPEACETVVGRMLARLTPNESLTVPNDLSEEEIRRMVGRLFVREDEDLNRARLGLVKERAAPYLIKALEDPRTASMQYGRSGAISPFTRIAGLLELGPREAVRPLVDFIDHENQDFREAAAEALGSIGTAECIAPVLKTLKDDDDVRYSAMRGIEKGVEAGRSTRQFLDAIFPALMELLRDDSSYPFISAAQLMLLIDAERALPVLLSPEYFTTENEELYVIIDALNEALHKVPHRILLPFLESAKPLVGTTKTSRGYPTLPYDFQFGLGLVAYAINPDDSAEPTVRRELASSSEVVRTHAAAALEILFGTADAYDLVIDIVDEQGFDALSTPQKHYYAVNFYFTQVRNGGHSTYFDNSYGDNWKWAMDGLKAVGADARLEILREATAVFGTEGPSSDYSRRGEQLERLSPQQYDFLDELDERSHSSDENISVLLAMYTIANKEHFTAR
ncbi:MAG: DUF4375 domain-containing protein [bacterium]|nr:DUF4375 domain-containing protein [bacterium]